MKTAMQELIDGFDEIINSNLKDLNHWYVAGFMAAKGRAILLLEKEKEQIKPLVDALEDIINWNEDLEEDWGDAGYRAKDALETYNQNK
jgi:hypothetical protein